MLGKLIKYDLKYGIRIFAVVHIILLSACILGRFLFMDRLDFHGDQNALFSSLLIFFSLFILLFSATSLAVTALLAVRFYKNLFTDEGYLTWTLPASPVKHLWAKIFSAYIWCILDALICTAALYILLSGQNVKDAYFAVASEFTDNLGMPPGQFGLYFLFYIIICSFSSILMIYACIAIGQLFPAHKILCSIVTYFILSAVVQTITFILMFALKIAPDMNVAIIQSGKSVTDNILLSFNLGLVLSLVMAVPAYLAVHYIMSKKLNLS